MRRPPAEEDAQIAICEVVAISLREIGARGCAARDGAGGTGPAAGVAADPSALLESLLSRVPDVTSGAVGTTEQRNLIGSILAAGHAASRLAGAEAGAGSAAVGSAAVGSALMRRLTLRLAKMLAHEQARNRRPRVTTANPNPNPNPNPNHDSNPDPNMRSHEQVGVAAAAAAALGVLGGTRPLDLDDGDEVVTPEEEGKGEGEGEGEGEGKGEGKGEGEDKGEGKGEGKGDKEGDKDGKGKAAEGAEADGPPTTKAAVVSRLVGMLSNTKVREKAVGALGRLGGGEPHARFRNRLLTKLFGLGNVKDVDLHFAVGEALARVGDASPAAATATTTTTTTASSSSSSSSSAAVAASPPSAAAALPPLPPIAPPTKSGIPLDAPSAERARLESESAAAVTARASAGGRLMGYIVTRLLRQHLVAWAPLARQVWKTPPRNRPS